MWSWRELSETENASSFDTAARPTLPPPCDIPPPSVSNRTVSVLLYPCPPMAPRPSMRSKLCFNRISWIPVANVASVPMSAVASFSGVESTIRYSYASRVPLGPKNQLRDYAGGRKNVGGGFREGRRNGVVFDEDIRSRKGKVPVQELDAKFLEGLKAGESVCPLPFCSRPPCVKFPSRLEQATEDRPSPSVPRKAIACLARHTLLR